MAKIDTIHQQWVATLDAIRDSIVVLDDENLVLRANYAFANLANCPVEKVVGQEIGELLPWLRFKDGNISDVTQTATDGRVFEVRSNPTDTRVLGEVYILEDVSSIHAITQAEQDFNSDSDISLTKTVSTLSRAQDTTDPYTTAHNLRVGEYSKNIALELGLSEGEAQGIYYGAKIHDIGKLSTPSSILNKPGRLTRAEMNLIRMHPETGYSIVKDIEFGWPVHEIILQHHERLDGSGYPFGLKGDEIALAAQIVAVADVVEAMSSHRPYRPSLGIDAALTEIEQGSGKSYNSEIVNATIKVVSKSSSQ